VNDAYETVLRLVSEGRLTAEEAAPILDALDAGAAGPARAAAPDTASGTGNGPRPAAPEGAPTALRIEVRDEGRQVVNLRLPLALGRFALERVPGLTGSHADRIREALQHGVRGPIVMVDDEDGDSVRIVLE
jgi:hypothetical protein